MHTYIPISENMVIFPPFPADPLAGTPRAGTPHWVGTPPGQCMLGYGQQAGGTHPTGMHSCLYYLYLDLQHNFLPHHLMPLNVTRVIDIQVTN